MSETPVLEFKELDYAQLCEYELDSALGYARTCYEQNLDRNLLRILINTIHNRRRPKTKLPLLAANVIRENVRLVERATRAQVEEHEEVYRAFKGAVMKAMSIRRIWQMENDAKKRAQGIPIPHRPKQTEHPQETNSKQKGQLRLFS